MERRAWSAHEDQVLKNLFERVKLNKWSLIARRMEEEYGLAARTGKQCRERYNNHLNPLMVKDAWTQDEERQLFRLHDELGNKWAVIAAKLGGRTDNSVKNHFFAKLRKSMRRINKIIQERFRKVVKELKLNVLYKIIEASEERFKKNPLCPPEVSRFSCSLKNRILAYAYDHTQEEPAEFQQLIEKVHEFGRDYKRKPKQLRRVASTGQDLPEMQEKVEASPDSNEDSEDEIVHPDPLWNFQQAGNESESAERKMNLRSNSMRAVPSSERGEVKEEINVEQLLQNKGLLEEDESPLPPLPGLLRRYTSSEFLMESGGREPFFQQSQNGQIPAHLAEQSSKKDSQQEDPLFG